MRAAIFFFSRKGRETALGVAECLNDEGYSCELYAPAKYAGIGAKTINGSLRTFTGPIMKGGVDAIVFIGACGIAVRSIAPYIKSKTVDPAVICIDECKKFAISLLSGHIGGGNRLTAIIAEGVGAVPVITTATDINGRFSVDAWAAENGFKISSMEAAKRVSAAILEENVPICADVPMTGALPAGLRRGDGEIGICVSDRKSRPFKDTLFIIPRVLKVGIGCRRATPCEDIETAVREVFENSGLDFRAVKEIASVTLKSDEEGLLEFCAKHKLPLSFYTPEELMAVEGQFSASEFVKNTVGADNVCERSAVLGGNMLIVPKTARNGVTVAVAEAKWEVQFG